MKRYENNPVVSREDVPYINERAYDVSSAFNPGAIKYDDKYILLLRVQNRGRETFLVKAVSDDGKKFEVDNTIVHFEGIEEVKERIYHCYDARITKINDEYYIMFAMDMEDSCKLGLAKTIDFETYKFLGIVSEPNNRNGVLFSEKIDGKYVRLERPNKVSLEDGPVSGNTICISKSDDLVNWEKFGQVMSGRFHYWDELIGSGPPPVKTRHGWLHVYHGVATHFSSSNIYQAGVVLLDEKDPSKVLARGSQNIIEPREMYELVGQVPNVIFPSGMIVMEYDEEGYAKEESDVFIYYGAADTSVGLAITTVKELLKYCHE